MSAKALPMLFINLGGEMIYILHQRLNAQKIDPNRAQKGRVILIVIVLV